MADEIEWRRAVWATVYAERPSSIFPGLPDPPHVYGLRLPPDNLVHPDEAAWVEEVGNLLVPRTLVHRLITPNHVKQLEAEINAHIEALQKLGEVRPNFPRVRLNIQQGARCVDMQLVPRPRGGQ